MLISIYGKGLNHVLYTNKKTIIPFLQQIPLLDKEPICTLTQQEADNLYSLITLTPVKNTPLFMSFFWEDSGDFSAVCANRSDLQKVQYAILNGGRGMEFIQIPNNYMDMLASVIQYKIMEFKCPELLRSPESKDFN